MNDTVYPLFSAHGVELEYMIVHADTLDVYPITDRVLEEVAGELVNEWEAGELSWSNELVLHVIELKTGMPAATLAGLAALFTRDAARIQRILEPFGARLMPTAAHPWMNPHTETRLWPHGQNIIYETFDRIFGCTGHGWSNLQSAHLNLPFANDEEFGRLHAAIRFLLPIMPALSASSPFMDGKATGLMDSRLEAYRHNADRIFSVAGHVVPERAYTKATYESEILERIYRDMASLDPEGVLRDEWVNARGAIARFERNTIEVRVLDVQECPASDLAVIHWITESLKWLCKESLTPMTQIMAWDEKALADILTHTIRDAESAVIEQNEYVSCFGLKAPCAARDIWARLAEHIPPPDDPEVRLAMEGMAREGSLARRMIQTAGNNPSRDRLKALYSDLCDHLAEGRFFSACM